MTLPSTTQRVLLQTDFDRFARLSHDDNPIHCDPDFAAKSHFGATVAHGMMLYSCICKALTEQVGPGRRAIRTDPDVSQRDLCRGPPRCRR
jgi:acyl dehydratase